MPVTVQLPGSFASGHPTENIKETDQRSRAENELAPQIESVKNDNKYNFVYDCITSQTFGDYLGDIASLPPTRRWVWYCKHRACPDYYSAWSCRTNFLQSTARIPPQPHGRADSQ
ncbi:hypothetical protein QBC32DRAFT_355780 [Pseudoneurospora amorphoporcata]|uniref:Uncharacterized protein n=1 Tax=Pseudoneurospora amorphoporcata TaxID=241081 RepID=A0AAN6NK47_9PEZI|nr:hypothetical protein QBC32DRAFT_355780 [Pseudoneurospora amorphoporcata]